MYDPEPGYATDPFGRPVAGWGSRVAAIVVDATFVFIMVRSARVLFGWQHTLAGKVLALVMATAYYGVLNGCEHGQTFGKRALRIAVRDVATGGPIGTQRAAVRYIFIGLGGAIPIPFLAFTLLDCLWPLWDRRSQALHDKLAGSLVIHVGRA